MDIADRVTELIAECNQPQPEDLLRLQEFLSRMKAAGVAKTREYDLPQPDTVGRTLVEQFQNRTSQF